MGNMKQETEARLAVLNHVTGVIDEKLKEIHGLVSVLNAEKELITMLRSDVYKVGIPEANANEAAQEDIERYVQRELARVKQAIELVLDPEHAQIVIAAVDVRKEPRKFLKRETREDQVDPSKPFLKPDGKANRKAIQEFVVSKLKELDKPVTIHVLATLLDTEHGYLAQSNGGPWHSILKGLNNVMTNMKDIQHERKGKYVYYTL